MSTIEPTQTVSETGYKQLLIEARKLRGRSGLQAYRRAKLLCQVFDDLDFRADCGNLDDFQAAAILDEYVEDLCVSFLDLRRILHRFPKPKAWSEGRLTRLYNEAMKIDEQEKPLSGKSRPANPETRQRLETQLVEARKELARREAVKVSEVDQLRARISELEAENASLRQRITELETAVGMGATA